MGLLNDLLTLYIASQGTCAHVQESVAFFIFNEGPEEWDRLRPDKLSFILGNNVLVRSDEDLTPQLIKHELQHARQSRKYGGEFLYRPIYLLSALKAKVLTGDGYNNPFEQEALDAENK